MKTTSKALLAGVLLAASAAPMVAEASVNFDVNVGVPGYSYYSPAQAYYPPVYYSAPRAFYRERDWRWERDHRYYDRRYDRFDHRRHW